MHGRMDCCSPCSPPPRGRSSATWSANGRSRGAAHRHVRAASPRRSRIVAEQRQLLDQRSTNSSPSVRRASRPRRWRRTTRRSSHSPRSGSRTLSTEAAGTLEQRKAQIEGLLKPMQELLGDVPVAARRDRKIARRESYSMLREQLGSLAEIQRTLNTQTEQLVTALRRPNTRGQWGEITLRRLVELAGMSNRCDFCEQTTVDNTRTAASARTWSSTCRASGRSSSTARRCSTRFVDAAARAGRGPAQGPPPAALPAGPRRARELSAKSYWSQFKRSPEFVVMFLPGEAFLYAAVEHDGDADRGLPEEPRHRRDADDADRAAQGDRVRLAAGRGHAERRGDPQARQGPVRPDRRR